MNKILIYTDGSASPNPGIGGFGIILIFDKYRKEISGKFRLSTNNRMELLSVIISLETIKNIIPYEIFIYSDSKYVIDSINKGWLFNWEKTNFKNRINSDLWKRFLMVYNNLLINKNVINFIWIKGHSTNIENANCDILASKNNDKMSIDIYYENKMSKT